MRKTYVGTIEKTISDSHDQYALTLSHRLDQEPCSIDLESIFSECVGKIVKITIEEADVVYFV